MVENKIVRAVQFHTLILFLTILFGCSNSNDQVVGSRTNGNTNTSISTGESVVSDSTSTDSDIASKEERAFELVNEFRESQGLSVLKYNSTVSDVCRTHSENMANGIVAFGHDGFTSSRVPQLQSSLGISSAAENVAYNLGYADPAETAVTGWINSPGHEANMSGNYISAGMGVAVSSDGSYYFTQIFIK